MTQEMQIETYLAVLRSHLAPLTSAERDEIIREIGAHIRDSAEEPNTALETVLVRLGPAEQLAAHYRDGFLILRASRSFSPLVLLHATLRLATKGFVGAAVFFFGVIGYAMGAGLVLCALIKPFQPDHTGVWFTETHTLNGGVLYPAPGASSHEILGWWVIPVALILGSLTLLATTFVIRGFLSVSRRVVERLQL